MLKTLESNTILNKIIDSIKELKGMDIVLLDLSKIENAICKFFVICTGNSNTHAKAIEDKIRRNIKKKHNENPLRVEGTNSSEWILMDYSDTIVHIFQKKTREYYKLEEFWGDSISTEINENN
ncbi:ribosome silencing factor [Bacteroidota bacterium]|nr:ribosome silencing factor [Bacteroidota bacterium]